MKKVLTNLTAFVLTIVLFSVNVFAGEYVDETELSMVKVEEYNSHTYAIYHGSITWEEARAWCENNGGHLVSITSREEQSFIESFNSGYDYLWIGAYRERVVDWEWKWVTGEKWNYTNWAEGEPNNSPNVLPDENCAVLWPMAWNDLSNENIYEQCGFICEWDNGSVEKPTEEPTEESYYFDVYIEGGIQLKAGEMYEIFIDTNSPLENPFKLESTNEKVFVVSGSCIIATGGGEANLLITDNYYGMMYSYPVYVEEGDVEEPTEEPTDEPTEAPVEDEIEGNVGQFRDHTYAAYRCFVTWEDAKEWCENNGGHLVTITSAEEQQFIESLNYEGSNLWIGAYREQIIDWEWKWVTGEKWDYTSWAEGEPNNSPNVVPDENCVTLWPHSWNDLNSNNVYEQCGFICEWEYVNNNVPNEAPEDTMPPVEGDGDSSEDFPTEEPTKQPTDKPAEDGSDEEIETKPAREMKMEITTTLKESSDPEQEAEVTVHIKLTELTDGNVEDSKVFIRATGTDGKESVQSIDGNDSIDVDVPVSKRQVKVFCFESITSLKPLCEAQIIEIEY